jgi:ABC-type amino acid transport substrate-binding protein
MKNFLLIVVAVITTLLVQNFLIQPGNLKATKKESAYDRVLRTGVLRCAYGLWEPAVMRDPNTGKMSGFIYDIMQEVGKSLNLKVEYALEVPWDSIPMSLQSGKADAHCAGIWATPSRGRVMAFSKPLGYSAIAIFARKGDNRFDYNLERINQTDIRVALSDDDITTEIYRRDFSKAQKYELPQLSPPEELFLAIATKKADITFNGPSRLPVFERSYPNAVKAVPVKDARYIFPSTVAVDIGEEKLLHVINTTIDQLINSGTIDRIIEKYRKNYDMSFFVPVDHSYSRINK